MSQLDKSKQYKVGDYVTTRYKGAFCLGRISEVELKTEVKIRFPIGLGDHLLEDVDIRGCTAPGSIVEAKYPTGNRFYKAQVVESIDKSRYKIVFDDGDTTEVVRSKLRRPGVRHFPLTESLDHFPLSHPDRFASPVQFKPTTNNADAAQPIVSGSSVLAGWTNAAFNRRAGTVNVNSYSGVHIGQEQAAFPTPVSATLAVGRQVEDPITSHAAGPSSHQFEGPTSSQAAGPSSHQFEGPTSSQAAKASNPKINHPTHSQAVGTFNRQYERLTSFKGTPSLQVEDSHGLVEASTASHSSSRVALEGNSDGQASQGHTCRSYLQNSISSGQNKQNPSIPKTHNAAYTTNLINAKHPRPMAENLKPSSGVVQQASIAKIKQEPTENIESSKGSLGKDADLPEANEFIRKQMDPQKLQVQPILKVHRRCRYYYFKKMSHETTSCIGKSKRKAFVPKRVVKLSVSASNLVQLNSKT